MKKKIIKNKNVIYIISLIIFSILINQYYGYKGILPIDSFLIFNSGFDILNGYYPFKDYWTIKEPFIDLLQALFFKMFGVSWFAYVFHASIFNCLITIATYIILKRFNCAWRNPSPPNNRNDKPPLIRLRGNYVANSAETLQFVTPVSELNTRSFMSGDT